jgi:hypothetical protein
MKRLLITALLGVPFFVLTVQAAQKTFLVNPNQTFTFINNGTISPTPSAPIDAVNFVNNGTFNAITVLPFESSSTLNFTNNGTMSGTPGFFFNNSPASVGQRQASASFFNGNNGLVQASPESITVDVVGDTVSAAELRIWADTVVNRGTLQVSPSGNLELVGKDVNLSRSVLDATSGGASQNPSFPMPNQTTFTPDIGLHDNGAVIGVFSTTNQLNTAGIWNGITANAPGVQGGGVALPGFSITFSTNFFPTQVAGTAEENRNVLNNIPPTGILIINYDFFTIPDTMDIYTNNSTVPIVSTGLINGAGTITIPYGTNVTQFVIVMNQGNNPDPGTAWQYTPQIQALSISTNKIPAAWYSNVVSTTTVTTTNFIGGGTNTVLVEGVFSNIVKGAVFANIPPEFNFDITFTPGRSNFNTIGLLLSLSVSNTSTASIQTNYLYFEDTLPQAAPRLLVNALEGTLRPSNYLAWSRQFVPPGPVPGTNVPGLPEANFFVDSGSIFQQVTTVTANPTPPPSPPWVIGDMVSNVVVQSGSFSGYSMLVDSLPVRPPLVTGGTVSNLIGSVRVHSDNLDISNARLRGEGEIFLQANHLNNSDGAVLDCENLRFDIGAPADGNLVVQNLAADRVEGRIRGPVQAWSATWSNSVQILVTNNYSMQPDPTGLTTNLVSAPTLITNTANVSYHVFMLDCSGLQTSFPVNVFDLLMHGTNVTVNDQVTIYESFFADCQSLTFNKNVTFPGVMPSFNGTMIPGTPIQSWVNTNAPTLLFFTNVGTFSIPNEAHFGDDRAVPYSAFVTRGSFTASSIQINSDYIEADGRKPTETGTLLQSQGILFLQSKDILFLNGTTFAGNFANLTSADITFSNHVFFTAGALNLSVSDNLTDLGTTNTLEVQDGINLLVKPSTGDLLNTTVVDVAPRSTGQFVSHQWAGEDRGPVAAGFLNNVALERLQFFASPLSVFDFAGVGAKNALYVDVLDLSLITSTNQLLIEDNMTIYYASILLPPGLFPPPGTLPEEFMDGAFNGHLHWVPSFAGPASSVTLNIDGKNYKFNEALRNSMNIDSDGDGIVNGLDSTPFRAPYSGPASASFTGLFYGTNGVQYLQSGAVSITTTKNGKYSGSLRTGTKKYSFSGKLDPNGADARNIPKSSLSISLQVGLDHVSGTVANGTNWTAQLGAERTAFGKSSKAPFAGTFSVTFPGSGDTNNALVPFANGTAKAKVNTAGKLTFNGKLGDGTKMSQTAAVSQDGLWPLYVPLYKGKGQILSWQSVSGPNVGGDFSWIQQPNATRSYPAGFKVETNATGTKVQ